MPTWVTGILYNNGFTQNPACLQSALFIPDKQAVRRGCLEVVSAVAGSGTWNFALVVTDEEEHLLEKRDDVRRLIIASEKQIESGATSHRAEVEHFIFVNTVVS